MTHSQDQERHSTQSTTRPATGRTPWPLLALAALAVGAGGVAVWQSSRPAAVKPVPVDPVQTIRRAPGTVPPPASSMPTQKSAKVAAPSTGMVKNEKVNSQVTDWNKIEKEREAAWAAARARAEAERRERERQRAEAARRWREEQARLAAERAAAQQAAEAQRRAQEQAAQAAAAAQQNAPAVPTTTPDAGNAGNNTPVQSTPRQTPASQARPAQRADQPPVVPATPSTTPAPPVGTETPASPAPVTPSSTPPAEQNPPATTPEQSVTPAETTTPEEIPPVPATP